MLEMMNREAGNLNNISDTQNLPHRAERSNREVLPDGFAFMINDARKVDPKCWENIEKIQNPVEKEKWINATHDKMLSL